MQPNFITDIQGSLLTPEEQRAWLDARFEVLAIAPDCYTYHLGDRTIKIKVQNIKRNEKPWWDWVFLGQEIEVGDILRVGYGDRLVVYQKKAELLRRMPKKSLAIN